MSIDIERIIHSLKSAIACAVAFFVSRLIGLTADPWIVVTVIVVMCAQIYVGSVVQKAYLRFLGTIIGCLLATIALAIAGNQTLTIFFTITFAAFLFSYLATSTENLSYAGTLGAVTTIIILMGANPTPLLASQRFLEISIGILIATLISQFVLPIHARNHLRREQINTLEQLRDFYAATMVTHSADPHVDYLELDQNIVASLVRQQKLAKESVHELFAEKYNADRVMLIIYCEREMLRAIAFMHKAYTQLDHAENWLAPLPVFIAFNTSTLASLNTLIKLVKTRSAPKEKILIPDVVSMRDIIFEHVGNASQQQSIAADGFLFSATVLSNALTKLGGLFGVISDSGK